MKVTLSPQFALTATCPPGRKKVDYWDQGSVCNGLVLEVRASGGRTWYLRYADQYGKQRQHKIGRYEDVGWEQVRKTARKLRAEVVLGFDPSAAKAVTKGIITIAELAEKYVAHAEATQRSAKTTAGYLKHVTSRWGRKHLDQITQTEVAKWLAEKEAEGLAPATVEKLKAVMGRAYSLAAQWGLPGSDRNPVRGIPRRRFANARTRSLNSSEIARLRQACAESRNPQLSGIVGLLLLTGARLGEILSLEWSDINVAQRTIHVKMSKSGKARHIPMSQAAIDVVAQIKRAKGARFVFPSRDDPDKHLTTIKHAWQTARVRAKVGCDLRLHDLRHAAASSMVSAGVELYAVGRILGHAQHSSTTQRYGHLAQDTLLAAVEAGAKRQAVDWSAP